MSKEIWATPTPSKAGPIRRRMFKVAGLVQAFLTARGRTPRRGNKPSRAKAGICTANCNTPPTITPTGKA